MSIKSRLQFMTTLSATLVVAMALMLFWANHKVAKAVAAQNLANEIVGSVFERSTLRSDYLLNANDRARRQWLSKHDHVIDRLEPAQMLFEGIENKRTILSMQRSLGDSSEVFAQIAENRALVGNHVRSAVQAAEIEARLVGQLLLKSYDTMTDARQLQEVGGMMVESTRRTVLLFTLVLVGLLAAFVTVTSWSLGRVVKEGIGALQAGARAIGAGNLDYRAPLDGGDEFTEVAAAFNVMTERLKAFHASLEREIAQRKRAAAEVERLNQDLNQTVAQLRAANKELESFSYSVSHDLRAPLRAIDSFSQIIMEDYSEKLDDEGREALSFIRGNTRSMGQLIDDLLAFSRLGRQEMRTAEIDMNCMVEQVFQSVRPAVEERTIRFQVGKLPSTVGDPILLRQALANLIGNAIKYTRLRDCAVIDVGGWEDGDEHVYVIRDNGVGFDMKYAHKLFGVFQRLHGAEEFEGTGVGLALVQRIVQRHGGRVWAEGTVGEGASFYFALPDRVRPESADSFSLAMERVENPLKNEPREEV